ncbi:MAG: TolC family protein [Candidatus Margulisiibacteriota bacterium]
MSQKTRQIAGVCLVLGWLIQTHLGAVTLAEAYQAALKKNAQKTLTQEQLTQQKSTVQQLEAQNQFQASLTSSLRTNAQTSVSGKEDTTFTLGLSAGLLVDLWSKNKHQIAAAEHGYASILSADQQQRLSILSTVSEAFFNIILLEKTLANQHTIETLVKKRLSQLQSWATIGRSRQADVLATQLQLQQLQTALIQTQRQLDDAHTQLAYLTGFSDTVSVDSPKPSTPAPKPAWIEKAKRHPSLLTQQATLDALSEQLAAQQANPLPDLGLSLVPQYIKNSTIDRFTWQIGGSMAFPLIDGGLNNAKITALEASIRENKLVLANIQTAVQSNVDRAYRSYISLKALQRSASTAVTIAQKNYSSVLGEYELKLVTNVDVLQALGMLYDALQTRDTALIQDHQAQLQLQIAAGDSL